MRLSLHGESTKQPKIRPGAHSRVSAEHSPTEHQRYIRPLLCERARQQNLLHNHVRTQAKARTLSQSPKWPGPHPTIPGGSSCFTICSFSLLSPLCLQETQSDSLLSDSIQPTAKSHCLNLPENSPHWSPNPINPSNTLTEMPHDPQRCVVFPGATRHKPTCPAAAVPCWRSAITIYPQC